MTRDFDARVRDLHEAPLDFDSVKGKAVKIKRNRRAAVAGSVLGVAAIITPVAVLASSNGDADTQQDFAETTDPTETAAPDPVTTDPEYVLGTEWHQADGGVVDLPDHDYTSAVVWESQLFATFWGGEVFSTTIIVAEDDTPIDTIDTSGAAAVNDSGTVVAWVQPDGKVIVDDGTGETVVGSVDMAAAGDSEAWIAAAVSGGQDCLQSTDGCHVYLRSNLGEAAVVVGLDGTNDVAGGEGQLVLDATEDGTVGLVTEVDEFGDTCGAIYDSVDSTVRWRTCDYRVEDISPDGAYFLGTQTQYDGIGPTQIAIVDAQDGITEVNSFDRDGWTVGRWAWSPDGRLLFSAFENGKWHLMAMTTDGELVEDLVAPIRGDEFSSSFVLIDS